MNGSMGNVCHVTRLCCSQVAETSRLSPSKIAAVVGVGVVVSLLLLLVLFSNDSRQLESTKPMTVA